MYLAAMPSGSVQVIGYSDNQGKPAANQSLSERRTAGCGRAWWRQGSAVTKSARKARARPRRWPTIAPRRAVQKIAGSRSWFQKENEIKGLCSFRASLNLNQYCRWGLSRLRWQAYVKPPDGLMLPPPSGRRPADAAPVRQPGDRRRKSQLRGRTGPVFRVPVSAANVEFKFPKTPCAAQRRGVFMLARIRNRRTAGCVIPGNLGLPSPRLRAPARSNLLTQEVSMFEGQSQADLETMMKANTGAPAVVLSPP